MTFCLAAGWGIVVLHSLVGWGRVTERLLRHRTRLPLGIAGAVGFAASMFIGGLLALAHLILPPVMIGFVLVGAAYFAIHLYLTRPDRPTIRLSPLAAILAAAVLCVVACRYLASAKTVSFQPLDDIPGYLVFPVKMLQTGHFAADPFSERRMAGLGGQPWGQSMVLALFDPTAVNLFDRGVAFLLLMIIAGQWLRSVGISKPRTLASLLVLALFYPIYLNCSSFAMISAEMLALFVLLQSPSPGNLGEGRGEGDFERKKSNATLNTQHSTLNAQRNHPHPNPLAGSRQFRSLLPVYRERGSNAVLIALVVAAICGMKTTGIPFTGAILASWFIIAAAKARSIRPLIAAFGIAIATLIFLLPWMVELHGSSGTFLFPLLGRGNSQLPPLLHTLPHTTAIELLLMSALTAAGGFIALLATRRIPRASAWGVTAAIFLLASAPVAFIVGANTGGASWMRYTQPIFYGLIPLPLAALAIAAEIGPIPRRSFMSAAFILVAIFLILMPCGWLGKFGPATAVAGELRSIADAFPWRPLASSVQVDQMRKLQDSVPPGAVILERLDVPELMNFSRNPIFIADHPGLAGPPPGIPNPPTEPALSDYLLSHGVRYVAYSYGDEANFRRADFTPPKYHSPYAWDQIVAQRGLAFQDALKSLANPPRALYDDGHNVMIDLAR